MKNLLKIIKIFFLIVFFFELLSFGLIFTADKTVWAADITFTPQVGIPGAEKGFGPGETYTFNTKDTKPIAQYIQSIYKYAIGIVGILATVVMMIGGIMWIMSGGSAESASEAKAWIAASLTGLILTLCSYLILATVNPALVNFKISAISAVTDSTNGCCEYASGASIEAKTDCGTTKNGTFYENREVSSGKCIEKLNPGCCIVYYKDGIVFTSEYKTCYLNKTASECSLTNGASLFSVPNSASGATATFDASDPNCNNYKNTILGLLPCQSFK